MKRTIIFITLSLLLEDTYAQKSCFDAANEYRRPYLERTSISFDSLMHHMEKGYNMLVGCQFPNDTFTTFKGKQLSIDKLKGKFLVLNFWSVHCPPCVNEIPSFHGLKKKYRNLTVLAFTLDSRKDIAGFLKKKKFEVEIIPEAESFVKNYSLGSGLPFTLLIDRQGKILHIINSGDTDPAGQMNLYNELCAIIDRSLKGN